MKKKKSPIELSNLYFTDYTRRHCSDPSFSPEDGHFDSRHGFLIDNDFIGIAAELHFHNIRNLHDGEFKGVRRKVSLLLFDATDRVLISSKQITVSIPGSDLHRRAVVAYPIEETEYKSGHTYRLQVRDDNAGLPLGEGCFHTYASSLHGDPSDWYEPVAGGIMPDGSAEMMKSCDMYSREDKGYRIRFEVRDNMHGLSPDVMPELELRLYYPANANVSVNFIEPRNAYRGDFTYIVDLPFGALTRYIGVYYAELLCMDHPIAGFVFVTDRDIEGHWADDGLSFLDEYDYAAACRRYNESVPSVEDTETASGEDTETASEEELEQILEAFTAPQDSDADEGPEEPDLLAELDSLTGLAMVKQKIRTYDCMMRFCMLRASKGLELFHSPLHAMFLGSPGTGKTTVAKLMGKMLKKAGVLSSGHVVACERSTLLGQYYSSEAEKTIEAIEKAQGGILFIDEAHSLFQPNDPKDPGKFVIETLMTALADPAKDDWMLILAGYPEGMKRLFDLNPGLKSRIPESNVYTFGDFSEEELIEIAERKLEKLDFTLSPDAKEALCRRLASDNARRDVNFGNARHVMNLINTEILPAMAVRVMEAGLSDRQSLKEIQASDIPMPTRKADPRRKAVGFSYPTAS